MATIPFAQLVSPEALSLEALNRAEASGVVLKAAPLRGCE